MCLGDGCCASMDSGFMGRPNATINTISDLFNSRIVIGGDIDFFVGVNVHAIRILTGGDKISYSG